MDDTAFISNSLETGSRVSGPWRLTVWERDGLPPSYVFSEEHANQGTCPSDKDISVLAKDILKNTKGVHVFIEHFVHALEINRVKMTEAEACTAKSRSILNNMRNCLEVVRVNNPDQKSRIHFIDPRMDIVAVLPDGKLYDAVSHYTTHLVSIGDINGAMVTIYEAFIHPLLSIVPDKFGINGRMTGVMERYVSGMTDAQKKFFIEKWASEVTGRVQKLSGMYARMHGTSSLDGLADLKLSYTDMVNKFMDMLLLAQYFAAVNGGMTASIIYAGSLHTLNFEEYLEGFGYRRTRIHENKSLSSCLMV